MADLEASRSHQRVGMACSYCRRRKIRCDGVERCGNCVQRKQTCVYQAVVPGETTGSLKETRSAAFPSSSSMSSLSSKAGGQLRGIGAPKGKSLGGSLRKKRASDDENEDEFDEPVKEIAPGRIIVVVGSASGRGRVHKEEHSSSGQSSTSSPTPLTPRSASEVDWDRSPYHAHSHLHPAPSKAATTPRNGYPSVINASNLSNPSSPSSYASSLPAVSAKTSPNVGPGLALPETGPPPRWISSWVPTATSPYFPSVLMGSPYAYEDSISLDRDQQTVMPNGPSSSPSRPSSSSSRQQQRQQQMQMRERMRALEHDSSTSLSSSAPGPQSVLGIYHPQGGDNAVIAPAVGRSVVYGSEAAPYAYPSSSSVPDGLSDSPSSYQITPDIYQAPLPEYDVPIDFSFLGYPNASSGSAFDHYRTTSSHSTTSNFSDATSAVDDGGLVYLPESASFISTSSSQRVRSLSSSGAYRPHYETHASARNRTQTAGAMPYNSSLLADQSALFEGLTDGASSFSLGMSLGGGDSHRSGQDVDGGEVGGWGPEYNFFE